MTSPITDNELKEIQELRALGIPRKIQEWANANGNKILEVFGYKGGWEVWAQTELCWYFRHFMFGGRNLEILREQWIYAGKTGRADMVVRSKNVPKNQGGVYIIEFKTERCLQDPDPKAIQHGDINALQTEVQTDYNKLKNFKGIEPDGWGDTIAGALYSIVMTKTPEADNMMKTRWGPQGYSRTVDFIKDGSDPLVLWVNTLQFNKP